MFKYRSTAALQSLFILPRDPTPLPLEDRDPAALTPDERLELIRVLQVGAYLLTRLLEMLLTTTDTIYGSSEDQAGDQKGDGCLA